MLAAESAWRVLIAEHGQMRVYLAAIARRIEQTGWYRGPELEQVRLLARSLQRFDLQHQPKGTALLAALRQRGDAMQQFLDELESEGERCRQQLARAIDMLADSDPTGAAGEACAAMLRDHVAWMLRHLDREDRDLRIRALRELGEDEWSLIVSSISASMGPNGPGRLRAE